MAELEAQKAVELVECGVTGVREAKVIQHDTSGVEWDRFMRLGQTAHRMNALKLPKDTVVLDVGGFDGALALFVPELRVWVIDPATTGGSGLAIPFPDRHFAVVASIDALEHVPRSERPSLLEELVRVTRSKLFLNYPEAGSMDAQKQVLSLIPNKFIQEHVEYVLPSRDETIARLMSRANIKVNATGHTSINVWVAWYVLFHTLRERGLVISEFLKTREQEVSQAPFLYDLLECTLKDVE